MVHRVDRKPGLTGVGLGLRWEFLEEVVEGPTLDLAFFEVSPENYMRRGGYFPWMLERVEERYPLITHGLTLSIGSSAPPEAAYLAELRSELRRLHTAWHSDHLCFSSTGNRSLHDLLPLKFSKENVDRIAERVPRIEDTLGTPFALENITYYAHPGRREMEEAEFVSAVLDASRASLLLDLNNVFVNSRNHRTDPLEFLERIPLDRVIEIHLAGYGQNPDGLLIDTHGAEICDPVYDLLGWTIERTGPIAVLLERDHAVPKLSELMNEIKKVRAVYDGALVHFEESRARRD